jgi:hypothetical protein
MHDCGPKAAEVPSAPAESNLRMRRGMTRERQVGGGIYGATWQTESDGSKSSHRSSRHICDAARARLERSSEHREGAVR